MLLTTRLSCQTSGYVIENAIKTRWDVFAVVRRKGNREQAYTMIVILQVADLSHENFKSSRVILVDFEVVLVPSQVVNPSDSQVYPPVSVLD